MSDRAIKLPDAASVPKEEIPQMLIGLAALQTALAARLLNASGETPVAANCAQNGDELLTGKALATRLNVPKSWVHTEERAGRIPSFRLGKYVRFKPAEVESH
jgi:hypothetical protein